MIYAKSTKSTFIKGVPTLPCSNSTTNSNSNWADGICSDSHCGITSASYSCAYIFKWAKILIYEKIGDDIDICMI